MTTTFSDLGIRPELVTAISKQSVLDPTPIQVMGIPPVLAGRSVYLQAETGTGKTLAYLLPIFTAVTAAEAVAQSIVVAPTHELALQIHQQCTDLSQLSGLPIRSLLLIGGTSIDRQLEKLKKKPHVVVGTPGRIRELIMAGKLKVHRVRTIVVDEADKVLGSERIDDVKAIVKATQKDRSLVFVSATESQEASETIGTLSQEIDYIKASAAPINPNIEHLYLTCEQRDKPELVRKLIHALKADRALVFVHRNETAEILAGKLLHHKMRVADIHGTLHKEDRKRAMAAIRSGDVDVLIASDVAARGLDIKGVSHVINLDIPGESDAYLHRVGRTGRAGAQGVAVSLLSGPEIRAVKRLQRDLGLQMKEVYLREGQVRFVENS